MSSIDYRQQLRFRANFPCRVITGHGEEAAALVRNISRSGLQLAGDHELIQTLYPNFKRCNQHQPIAVDICFKVPTRSRLAAPVKVSCQLVYCRRYRGQCYWIGCHFATIDASSQAALEDFITYVAVAQPETGPHLELPAPLREDPRGSS